MSANKELVEVLEQIPDNVKSLIITTPLPWILALIPWFRNKEERTDD